MSFDPKETEQVSRRLLAEIEEIITKMPPRATIRHDTPANVAWFGHVSAAIEAWNPSKAPVLGELLDVIMGTQALHAGLALQKFLVLLNQARHDLMMQLPDAGTVVVPGGMVFDYFDGLRKIIELAKLDLLFVDPYLEAEFVSRYLPYVGSGVTIRLLAREKLATLLPAVEAFVRQTGTVVHVRTAAKFHDRYLLVDGTSCYQSGASFKDGAKTAPTTLTQITDAFVAVAKTYEDLWNGAKIER